MSRIFRSILPYGIAFLVGIIGCLVWQSVMYVEKNVSETTRQSTESLEPVFIPELIANQIQSGEWNCPVTDPLSYEACLLFKGGIGVWHWAGLKSECPKLYSVRSGKYDWRGGVLTPEDALRAPSSPCFGYLYAIGVANAIPILISTATKMFYLESGKSFSEPGSNPELCLKGRFGSCGNQAAVALSLFHKVGFKARPVQFYYEENGRRLSHIVPEVLIDGKWRLIDTRYGAFWILNAPNAPFELASTEEVLNTNVDKLIKRFDNNAIFALSFFSEIAPQNPFGYLGGNASILRGGIGSIGLTLSQPVGKENFDQRPNYIGDNLQDDKKEGVSYVFHSAEGEYSIQVKVSDTAIINDQPLYICIDDNCIKYQQQIESYNFTVLKPRQLYVKSEQDVGYAVLSSIDWAKN